MPRRSSSAGSSVSTRPPKTERFEIPIVTLLSDFGLEDGYVAGMKGVILSRCPRARIVDVTHQVPPFDIRSGSYVLKTVFDVFPPGTIHLAVVDPGVGTDRRALAVKLGCGRILIGPDNGLLSWVLAIRPDWESRSLENPEPWGAVLSRTFHGRDLFAPVAAHLACGFPFELLGPACSPERAPWIRPERRSQEVLGEVVHVDHFGNLITNITREDLGGPQELGHWGVAVPGILTLPTLTGTYGDLSVGEAAAIVGSSGHIEIAVNQGSAARILSAATGTKVAAFRTGARGAGS